MSTLYSDYGSGRLSGSPLPELNRVQPGPQRPSTEKKVEGVFTAHQPVSAESPHFSGSITPVSGAFLRAYHTGITNQDAQELIEGQESKSFLIHDDETDKNVTVVVYKDPFEGVQRMGFRKDPATGKFSKDFPYEPGKKAQYASMSEVLKDQQYALVLIRPVAQQKRESETEPHSPTPQAQNYYPGLTEREAKESLSGQKAGSFLIYDLPNREGGFDENAKVVAYVDRNGKVEKMMFEIDPNSGEVTQSYPRYATYRTMEKALQDPENASFLKDPIEPKRSQPQAPPPPPPTAQPQPPVAASAKPSTISQEDALSLLRGERPGTYLFCDLKEKPSIRQLLYVDANGVPQRLWFAKDKEGKVNQLFPDTGKSFASFEECLQDPEISTLLRSPVDVGESINAPMKLLLFLLKIQDPTKREALQQLVAGREEDLRLLNRYARMALVPLKEGISRDSLERAVAIARGLDALQKEYPEISVASLPYDTTKVTPDAVASLRHQIQMQPMERLQSRLHIATVEVEKGKSIVKKSEIDSTLLQEVKNKQLALARLVGNDSEALGLLNRCPGTVLAPLIESLAAWDGGGDLPQEVAKSFQEVLSNARALRQAPEAAVEAPPMTDRRKSPLAVVIKEAAGLFEATTKARAQGMQPLVTSGGEKVSLSDVYLAGSKDAPTAYFKMGAEDRDVAPVMERMMWDMAGVLGLEEQFTATMPTQMQQMRGTIQPPKGVPLGKFTGTVPPQSVIDATVTSLVIGSFDLHKENLLVNDGKLLFFDNTRSMPHSNDFLSWGPHLIPSYRSALLGLEQSYADLSPEERLQMSNRFQAILDKLKPGGELERYFERPDIKAQLSRLPPGWWDQKQVLGAMKQRIERALEALQKPLNLRDLAMHVNPRFKLYSALQIAARMTKLSPKAVATMTESGRQKLQRDVLGLENQNLQEIINICAENKIDLNELQKRCQGSFDELVEWLADYLSGTRTADPVKCKEAASILKEELQMEAVVDYKDIPRASVPTCAQLVAIQRIGNARIDFRKDEDPENIKIALTQTQGCLINLEGDSFILHHLSEQGSVVSHNLDVNEVPGKFIVLLPRGALPPMTASELPDFALGSYSESIERTLKLIRALDANSAYRLVYCKPGDVSARLQTNPEGFIQQVAGTDPAQFKLHVKVEGLQTPQQFDIDVDAVNKKVVLRLAGGGRLPSMDIKEMQNLQPHSALIRGLSLLHQAHVEVMPPSADPALRLDLKKGVQAVVRQSFEPSSLTLFKRDDRGGIEQWNMEYRDGKMVLSQAGKEPLAPMTAEELNRWIRGPIR